VDQDGPRRLSLCPLCGRDFVVAVDGSEGHESWLMVLRCGACGEIRNVIASDEEVEALCEEIDAGLGSIAAGAERMHRDRREAEIAIFAAALARDLISVDDFAP
jgi:hypothetical protein